MLPVSSDLNKVQSVLRDTAGLIWSRTELLRWYNDGYQLLLGRAMGAKRITILDVPPRYGASIAHEWEDQHAWPGTLNKSWFTALQGAAQCSTQWEVQFLDGIAPENSAPGHTQQWERQYFSGSSNQHYQFALPKTTDYIKRVAWDDKRLLPVSTRELDLTASKWYERPGTPRFLTAGLGRVQTFEVFEVTSTEGQGYWVDNGLGMPRKLSSDSGRVYTMTPESQIAANAWAYMSQGDMQGVTFGQTFNDNEYAITNTWEASHVPAGAAYVWTLELPGVGFTATHPWEVWSEGVYIPVDSGADSTYLGRGMFWWEAQNNHCQPVLNDKAITIGGMGYRMCPFQSVTDNTAFCMFEWERATIDNTTIAASLVDAYSFPWEQAYGHAVGTVQFNLGVLRTVTSPDRQYLAVSTSSADFAGCGRVWNSSPGNVTVLHTLTQDRDLNEGDAPDLIPPQLRKYIRRYVLAKAYERTGEGYNPQLSSFYGLWFNAGVNLFNTISDLTRHDRVWRRDDTSMRSGRMPHVRLPSTFEQVGF